MKDTSNIKESFTLPESLRQAFEFWVKSEAPAREVFRNFTTESKEIQIPQRATRKRTKRTYISTS